MISVDKRYICHQNENGSMIISALCSDRDKYNYESYFLDNDSSPASVTPYNPWSYFVWCSLIIATCIVLAILLKLVKILHILYQVRREKRRNLENVDPIIRDLHPEARLDITSSIPSHLSVSNGQFQSHFAKPPKYDDVTKPPTYEEHLKNKSYENGTPSVFIQ